MNKYGIILKESKWFVQEAQRLSEDNFKGLLFNR